jgi:hypothetical protein
MKKRILNSGTVRVRTDLNEMVAKKLTSSRGLSGSSIILFYEEQ